MSYYSFVAELKFELFWVAISSLKKNIIFGFPEGYSPGGKTFSEVGATFYYALELHNTSVVIDNCLTLYLHADNYSGKQKQNHALVH